MAISQAMEMSGKGSGRGDKIPATCPVSGRRTILEAKGKSHSDEEEEDDDDDEDEDHIHSCKSFMIAILADRTRAPES